MEFLTNGTTDCYTSEISISLFEEGGASVPVEGPARAVVAVAAATRGWGRAREPGKGWVANDGLEVPPPFSVEVSATEPR